MGKGTLSCREGTSQNPGLQSPSVALYWRRPFRDAPAVLSHLVTYGPSSILQREPQQSLVCQVVLWPSHYFGLLWFTFQR